MKVLGQEKGVRVDPIPVMQDARSTVLHRISLAVRSSGG